MLEDDVLWADDVGRRYGDVTAATALALETFVSVPVRDHTGQLCGTLCAASTRTREADRRLLELMQLFAEALGDRMSNGLVEASPASSSGLDRAS